MSKLGQDIIAARAEARRPARSVQSGAIRARLYVALLSGDALAMIGGMAAASAFRLDEAFTMQTLNVLAVLLPLFMAISLNGRAFGREVLENWRVGLRRSLSALGLTALIVLGIGFALKVSSDYSRVAIVVGFAISAILLISSRYIVNYICNWALPFGVSEEILLCDDAAILPRRGAKVLNATALGLKPVLNSPLMLDRIGKALRGADRVVVVCQPETRRAWTIALKGLGINVEVLLPEVEKLGVIGTGNYGDLLTAVVARGPLGVREQVIKRAFDLSVVLAMTPILLVVTALVALAIKLDDGGPIFFVQSRIGHGNRLFNLYKFRSMRVSSADATGAVSTKRDDDRVTRVGRLLRMTSIDELPQLFNVLWGDMSVVGPRPHALASTAGDRLFWDVDDRYWCPSSEHLAQVAA